MVDFAFFHCMINSTRVVDRYILLKLSLNVRKINRKYIVSLPFKGFLGWLASYVAPNGWRISETFVTSDYIQ